MTAVTNTVNRANDFRLLAPILVLSLILNVWGNYWGAPKVWHPDELIQRTRTMVGDRTVNPHYFTYGGLHYYVLAIGAIAPIYFHARLFDPPTRDDSERTQWWERRLMPRIFVAARVISALMSTLVVWIVFIVGRLLFTKTVGYLAALFLTVSMSFVAVAHFATVDSPTNFWYWLSCLFALL